MASIHEQATADIAAASATMGGYFSKYSYVFDFERDFEHLQSKQWMQDNWSTVTVWAAVVYITVIFTGQAYMSSRPKFELRTLLWLWNLSLASFSIMGALRTLPEFINVLSTQGIYASVCTTAFIEEDRVSGFWTLMFVLSKLPELGDTVFIVLRKQPLIFLHWYHHVTVLLYSWYSYSEYTAAARWFVVMNYIVHSLMYTYYAFKALRFRVPKFIAMTITALQLVQMVVGCLVNIWVIQIKSAGQECHTSDKNIKLSLLMYFSYFVLFGRFFYNAYLRNKEEKAAKQKVK